MLRVSKNRLMSICESKKGRIRPANKMDKIRLRFFELMRLILLKNLKVVLETKSLKNYSAKKKSF